jgi:hypothetical protein
MFLIETTNKPKYSNFNYGDTVFAVNLICRLNVELYSSRSFIGSNTRPHLTNPDIASIVEYQNNTTQKATNEGRIHNV